MIRSLTLWMLAGALAASLAWNLRTQPGVASEPGCGTCMTSSFDCARAIDTLRLSPEQRSALEHCGKQACAPSGSSGARADELARELCTLLASPTLDHERALAMADEIGRLRGQCLRECVGSVVEVRKILTPEQVRELLAGCCAPKGD